MTDLREVYQEVILAHNNSPRNFRAMDSATVGYNYPQYSDYPAVNAPMLRRMAGLLGKHRLVDLKGAALEGFIDSGPLREAAVELGRDR